MQLVVVILRILLLFAALFISVVPLYSCFFYDLMYWLVKGPRAEDEELVTGRVVDWFFDKFMHPLLGDL